MKKNRMMRLASGLLVAVLLTTSVISGTFAKYTSSVSTTATARVAQWSISVEEAEIAVTGTAPTITFSLFDTVDDLGGETDDENVDESAGVIAPGTEGSFAFDIVNNSEVTAKYTIILTETNANIPLQYKLDNGEWKDSIAELALDSLAEQTIAMNGGSATRTIYWRWVFDNELPGSEGHEAQTNGTDTELGINGGEVSIKADITVEQVD